MSTRPFRYLADPLCSAALAIYTLNRFYLKPHHLGGAFTHNYLNDLLCLPLLLPIILRLQNLLGLRPHAAFPRLWEIAQHWLIFSIMFEVILPRFPHTFATTADPLDILAYAIGGLLAALYWRFTQQIPIALRLAPPYNPTMSPKPQSPLNPLPM